MSRRLFEILFIASAIILVALIGLLNCLQGTPLLGGFRCNLSYTSNDLIIKLIATVVFLLFVGLILGPIAVTVIRPVTANAKKTSGT
jgi:hypothetical protein